MAKPDVLALTDAVQRLHGVKAVFVGSVAVHEQFQGQTVWKGLVSQFELQSHPAARLCYAWSVPATSDKGEVFYAVLQTPDVDTPEKAVRASVVADHRNKP